MADSRLDLEDVERVRAGDVDAFAGIVERWQRPLHALAWRACRDRSRAEDLVQEILVKAFKAIGSFRGDAAFSTWLFALAINHVRSEMRRRPPMLASLEDAAGIAATESHAASDLRVEALHRAVAALPAAQREALTLFYFEDMDLAAAARRLCVPEGTLKARLFRAREHVKRRMEGLLGTDGDG